MRKVEACTRALQLRSAVLAAAGSTSLRAAGASDVTRSLLPPPLPTSSYAVPAPLPMPTAPFAASPLLDPYPLVSIDDPLEDNEGIECAVPKKKVHQHPFPGSSARLWRLNGQQRPLRSQAFRVNGCRGGSRGSPLKPPLGQSTDFQVSQAHTQFAEDDPVREIRNQMQVRPVNHPFC